MADGVDEARHDDIIHPNIATLRELKQAGVELRVCGQDDWQKLEPSQVLPAVQVDLSAMTRMVKPAAARLRPIGGRSSTDAQEPRLHAWLGKHGHTV